MLKATNPILNRAGVWVLAIGLIYGAFQKGAFYAADFKKVFALALLSGAVAVVGVRSRPSRSVTCALAGLLGIAVLGLLSGADHGSARRAFPLVGSCISVACVVYGVSSVTPAARRLLAHLLMLIGLIVAFTSWYGVAFHHYPWALLSQTLWRGASTLTYANAAAALLFAPMVISAVAYIQTRRRWYLVVAYLLTAGWAATLSRAAGLSLVVALVVVLVRSNDRRSVLCLWPLVPAVLIAFVALLPSLPEHDSSQPVVALVGVAVGLVVLIGLTKVNARYSISALLVALVVVVVLVSATGEARTAIDRINSTRVDMQSTDRTDLLKVTWKQFKENPIDGVGPGQVNFVYVSHSGETVRAQYTHNEYLQLATEVGFGAVVFLVALFGGLLAGMRSRSWDDVGALVVLLGFALHSSLDFLWHIPEVTLVAVASSCVLRAGVEFRGSQSLSQSS